MLAEIHNKISGTGSNLSDRLEDKLTGDIFGAIRYLPFEIGLSNILSKTVIKGKENLTQLMDGVKGYNYEIKFWVRSEFGELDVLVCTETADIAIEVKYLSGLSSDDNVDNSDKEEFEESSNQLSRYADLLNKESTKQHKVLIFLAPASVGVAVANDVMSRKLVRNPVVFGFLSWQDVLNALKDINLGNINIWQRRVVGDMVALLEKKGFDRFVSFLKGINISVSQVSYFYQQSPFMWNYDTGVKEELFYVYKG